MKVALVYDRINKWGGAERVLVALHTIFPDAPLFTSVYNPQSALWAKKFKIFTSFLQHVPFAKTHHELFAYAMPLAFESFTFDEYDLVISVTSEAAKGIITKPTTKHICLCLTPTRYLWSGYTDYFTSPLLRFITLPIIWYLRLWDTIAANRPDKILAISQEVQKRIKKYYNKDSEVIYPPIMMQDPRLKVRELRSDLQKEKYFLVVSRLSSFTWYKRVDIAIRAANHLKINLKIIGDGNQELFKNIAGPTVTFIGSITDERLAEYYTHAQALIFPGLEDFGLVMVEAQSYGTPVIAYGAGGALEIVIPGKTGDFFHKQSEESLIAVLEKFDKNRYNSSDCIKNAARFSLNSFEKALRKQLKDI